MRSDKQRETARLNGAKSRGPKTAEGKQRSSANSFKHGVYSDAILLDTDDPEELEALRDMFFQRFQPRDAVEDSLVEDMVHAQWRTQRMQRLQTTTTEIEIAKFESHNQLDRHLNPDVFTAFACQASLKDSNILAFYHNLEFRYRRAFSRALRDLERLRKAPFQPDTNPEIKTEGTNPTPPPTHSEVNPTPEPAKPDYNIQDTVRHQLAIVLLKERSINNERFQNSRVPVRSALSERCVRIPSRYLAAKGGQGHNRIARAIARS